MSTSFWDDIEKLIIAEQEIVLTDLSINLSDPLIRSEMYLVRYAFFFDRNNVLRCKDYPNCEYKLEWYRARWVNNPLGISNWVVELTPESLIRSLLSDPL